MGFRSGTGKVLIVAFSIAFGMGVTIAVLSPSWIAFQVAALEQDDDYSFLEVHYGPFYGQKRTCVADDCSRWRFDSLHLNDCDDISGDEGRSGKVCRLLLAWRSIAIIFFIFIAGSGIFVWAGAWCQAFTCGCCGGSVDVAVMIIYWFEVLLSIIAWSLVISAVNEVKKFDRIMDSSYEWGFWMFLVFGTFVGIACAVLAGWASENSMVMKIYAAITGVLSKLLCC